MFSLARFLLTILFPLLFLDVAQAACFPRHAFSFGWYDSWPRSRPVDCLFQGRLRATLGERRHRLDAWRDLDRYRYRRDPFWQQRYYRDRRVGIYFHGEDYLFQPAYRRRSARPERVWPSAPPARRIYPGHDAQVAHRAWCRQHYRSYRADDNSFQPRKGARRRCRSPYGR
ncbi:BA14K family protein [Nitratireductor sp. ZSWI3]|uniref:BA14K family protein n=1 Tax=Nitratireductor sp. ZSWI3 TaxID=2966359 RepID=UPI0021500B87|nr:BA14K family protein [Nitratireductor sp. ZSWI3]MCR4268048.1 BA14K family protein [Nitratireductor sp. ZSWI3]